MMESALERNKATVLEAFDTLFNKRPRRKLKPRSWQCCANEGERWCDLVEKLLEARAVEIVTRGGAGPGGKSRFEMLIDSKEHEMHHRAQLMVIERLLGIVPHLTRKRQRPQESAQRSTT